MYVYSKCEVDLYLTPDLSICRLPSHPTYRSPGLSMCRPADHPEYTYMANHILYI